MTSESDRLEASLEVVKGAEPGRVLPLAGATATLGRAPGNTLVLEDAAISRQHARIFVREGRHWIADLNSSHGTLVNGAKVTLHALAEGDVVQLGATLLRYAGTRAAAAPSATAEDGEEGGFELEHPAGPEPRARPPDATSSRRDLTPQGEDPFADEAAPAPAIELRGQTARQFASRGAGAPAPPSPATSQSPPPRVSRPARPRGPFSFLRDELDQRGPGARFAAALFAIGAAVSLGWLALRLFEAVPPPAAPSPAEGGAPGAPARPELPARR